MLHYWILIKNIVTKSLLFSIVFLLILAFALYFYISNQKNRFQYLIYPNVFINKTQYGGLNRQQLNESFYNKNAILKKIQVELNFQDKIATLSGEDIKLAYDIDTIWQQSYSIGRSENFWTRAYQELTLFFKLDNYNLNFVPNYNLEPTAEFLADLSEEYNVDPVDALFEIKDNKVSAFKIEKNGLKIDDSNAILVLRQKLNSINLNRPSQEKITVQVESNVVEPEIKLNAINQYGIVEKIGEGISDYSGSIPGRVHNLILAASKFHGVLIKKDELISFNKIVGDISANTGYQQAYIIKQGRTVLGDGGGVCQVSTTLFRAALNAGLPITERHAHAYRVHYYENDAKPGLDATVFAPSVDLKAKNDTPAYILIQTSVDKNKRLLTFSLYGKKDDRKLEISPIKVWDVKPAPEPVYQDDPTLPKGVTKQVDWSAPGTKATFHYRVTKGDEVIQDTDFFSNFKP